MDEIAEETIRTIARTKGVEPETIHLDTTLDSLSLDSLDRVTLSFDLEEQYRIEIPEHILMSLQTVNDVVIAVANAMAGVPKHGETGTTADRIAPPRPASTPAGQETS